MKNRISARKCRQKKKEYYDSLQDKVCNLEKELEKYKNLYKQKNSVNFLIDEVFILIITQLDAIIKEIIKSTDKTENLYRKLEYKTMQKKIIHDLFRKILRVIMPIEYNIFANKFIKFNDISMCETTNQIVDKIVENQEMCEYFLKLVLMGFTI